MSSALVPLTKRSEIRNAYSALESGLKDGAVKYRRTVGWRGGNDEFTLFWHPKERFWTVFSEGDFGGYWCPYGTADPNESSTMSITCEINPPEDGVNRRKGGVFLRDAAGTLFLGHTGKLAGGRKGIGKSSFLERYSGSLQEIEWPDGVTSEVVVLGRIGGGSLLRRLGRYLHAIENFKNAVALPSAPTMLPGARLTFRPEFQGPRKRYSISGLVESQCDHGTVVQALHDALEELGLHGFNTVRIDQYLVDKRRTMTHLFEVKTDCTTTSLYQAVGQAMLHGALEDAPRRILVLPGQLEVETQRRMELLGIALISYKWADDAPVFTGLERAVK